jgi:leucyl aminopeptidase
MRQLFEKSFHRRLKNLHWETAEQPVGRFCYFLNVSMAGAGRNVPPYFKEPTSVMDFKGRLRLESASGTLCDCYFIEESQSEHLFENLRRALGALITDADNTGTRDIQIFCHIQTKSSLTTQSPSNSSTSPASSSTGPSPAQNSQHPLIPSPVLLGTIAEALESACYSARVLSDEKDLRITLKLPPSFCNDLPTQAIDNAINEGLRRGRAFNFARYLGDLPGNVLTPQALAQEAGERLKNYGTVKIFNEKELVAQEFGGLLAVAQGSKNRPQLVTFESTCRNPQKSVVLIGKGITFDTGGYSVKGKQHHNEMKYDMCGAANTIAALEVLAPLLPNTRLIGILPLAENMISDEAQRPGDVYRAHNGKLIEVYNTDAEGRLILADALSYAGSFQPDLIIDIATLTGGTAQIAGNLAAIMCTNDDTLIPLVRAAGRRAGEKFIHLEIVEDAIEDMKSDVADYTNMHNKWSAGAPTMYAAAFLKEFVPAKTRWIHLDIANMAWCGRNASYLRGRGATGFGARTLVNITQAYCASE